MGNKVKYGLKVYYNNGIVVGVEFKVDDDILYKNMLNLDYNGVDLIITSNLNYIRDLILDEFKIDKLFCENILIYIYNNVEKDFDV